MFRTLIIFLSVASLGILAGTCAGGSSDPECLDGIQVDGVCWPIDCETVDCPEGFGCIEGVCRDPACFLVVCREDEGCAGGTCYPRDCIWRNCPGFGEVCLDEDCIPASCVGVECGQGERCASGRCYPVDCPTKVCPGYGEVCIGQDCEGRTCIGVTCPAGQACAMGMCFPSDCVATGCFGEGEVCVDGVCVRRPCVDVTCQVGFLCANGWCYPESCVAHPCQGPMEVCYQEQCIPADCVGVQCPSDHSCARGECFPENCPVEQCGDGEVCYQNECVNVPCVGVVCGPDQICVEGLCRAVLCEGDPDCSDNNDCTVDRCDPATGCKNTPVVDGSECGSRVCDGLSWKRWTCQAGDCTGSETVQDCAGTNECQDFACDNATGCSQTPRQDGLECGARLCQGSQWYKQICMNGSCSGTSLIEHCADGNDCTADSCVPSSGCTNSPVTNGTECGSRYCDGLQWRKQTCQSGACSANALVENCGDSESCTQDSCNASSGCQNSPVTNGTECGSRYCSGLEYRRRTCQSGSCSGSTLVQNCADTNSCTNDSCSAASGCSNPYLGDHTQCGANSSDRCCGGSCVDIRSNTSHCGGCFADCASGLTCEDVAATTGCSSHPSGVSGRCNGCTANSQCPLGQICRSGQPSYNNRCAPRDSSECSGLFVDVSSCPNYCRY